MHFLPAGAKNTPAGDVFLRKRGILVVLSCLPEGVKWASTTWAQTNF